MFARSNSNWFENMKRLSAYLGIILISCLLWVTSCDHNRTSCGKCEFHVLMKDTALKILDTIVDVNGNSYTQVQIGDQVWLGENLRCTFYENDDGTGVPITNYDTMGARFSYLFGEVDSISVKKYGLLYNWAAARRLNDTVAKDGRIRGICPRGFHLPSDEEWHELVNHITNCTSKDPKTSVAKSLAAHDSCWRRSTIPNTPGYVPDTVHKDTNNASHFAAMPVGNCIENASNGELRFYNFSGGASFWSSTPYGHRGGDKLTNPNAYGRYIGYNDVVANKCVSNKKAYFPVRCVKD